MIKKQRVSCPLRHVVAFILKHDDGSFSVKCSNIKTCSDTCPYLENPSYRSPYKRAPEYKPR